MDAQDAASLIWKATGENLGHTNVTRAVQRLAGDEFFENRHPGSGADVNYTKADIRGAVAYHRFRACAGEARTSRGFKVAHGVREIAREHNSGYAYVLGGDDPVFISDLEEAFEMSDTGIAILLVPLDVEVLNSHEEVEEAASV